MRYFAEVIFLGTNYSGWQVQPNAKTVQGEIQSALGKLLGKPITVTGCGRTDAGVHGRNYVLHFDGEFDFSLDQIVYKLNAILPSDIAFSKVWAVNSELHARYSATQRSYRYELSFYKNPYRREISYQLPRATDLDFSLMNEAANALIGNRSFKTFCKEHSGVKHYQCDLVKASWTIEGDTAFFDVSANRFLRGMVRLMVGALIDVGRQETTSMTLLDTVIGQHKLTRPFSVPAKGLHFVGVEYPDNDQLQSTLG